MIECSPLRTAVDIVGFEDQATVLTDELSLIGAFDEGGRFTLRAEPFVLRFLRWLLRFGVALALAGGTLHYNSIMIHA
jgi:hypothetical protein